MPGTPETPASGEPQKPVEAAEAAADIKGRTWGQKFSEFKVTEGYKADRIAKAGEDAAKIAKIEALEVGATRWGKVAGGIAAVAAAIYAGSALLGGKKEDRSFADAETQRRSEQGKAAGIA